ncbi:MAG: LysM peptidoglycan-binding domain-containing protein [Phycisphaeraceae bacterium]|nr:LysM peptidoglycan-binding domain-containing protein [Phycisphaeraceae bacterium]
MSLPSQSPRPNKMGRTYVRNHRRRMGRRPLAALVIVVVVGVVVSAWAMGIGRGEPAGASAAETMLSDPFVPDPTANQETARSTAQPARPEQERQAPNNPPPLEIRQGRPNQAQPGASEGVQPPARESSPPVVRPPETSTAVSPAGLGDALREAEPLPGGGSTPSVTDTARNLLAAAERRLTENKPVVARELLNRALLDSTLSEADRAAVRDRLTRLNDDLVFSPKVHTDDPLSATHVVQRGDSLERIARRNDLAVDWRLLQRVNRLANPNRIQEGQSLKLVRGPFHAVVSKSTYRLDLYAGPPADESAWVYIRSFPVGLGEGDSTPTGRFVVKRGSKLINPHWVNPRTGQKFDANDPLNPIGERWIGIEGLGDDAVKTGYGLHGTIEPHSIGRQMSMGCVRLLADDVELVYEMLAEGVSRVYIRD